MRKYNWKKILIGSLWILAGTGTIVLLGAAMQKKNQKTCADIKIEISGADRHMFIDEKDVLEILNSNGPVQGTMTGNLNLRQMESLLEKNLWVRNAEMYLDNNQVLQVNIEERQPVARVFAMDGSSFYIDSGSLRLPLSEKLSARVPVFTGFPSGKNILSHPDSVLLNDVVKMGKYILADSFWMAQVAQVDIAAGSTFEIVPVVGDHTVVFGTAEDMDKKFSRLYTFYKKAWLQHGINTYEKLNVQYDGQVVAIRKGATKAWVDSAKAHQLMQGLLMRSSIPGDSSVVSPATVTPKPVADTPHAKAAPVKPVAATGVSPTKTVVTKNNKTNNKPLSKGGKLKPKKNAVKKPAVKPKAVMEKTK
jgi:cell division protein FtsQ